MGKSLQLLKILGFVIVLGGWGSPANSFIVGHQQTDLSAIPDEWITAVKEQLDIVYQHTSHGSQIATGLRAASDFPAFNNKYEWVDPNGAPGATNVLSLDDYGIRPGVYYCLSTGDSPVTIAPENPEDPSFTVADWAIYTRNYLLDTNNYHINVVMWSWCNIAGHDLDLYIRSMEWLIAQFSIDGSTYTDDLMLTPFLPHARAATDPVQFVFITGHANGGGENDSSDSQNQIIRNHCAPANWDRILYDFADIENYDPDGNYYLDKRVTDALYYDKNGSHDANWADEYLMLHDGEELYEQVKGDGSYSGCSSCSHSEGPDGDARLNCVLKGRAAWHLFARLAGWNGGESLKGDMDGSGELTAADAIVGLKVLAGFDSTVAPEGDADGDGVVGMSDMLYLLVELAKP